MTTKMINTRNTSVDIVRGIAMLMVVLGHTISGTCVGYEDTFLFRVIWTLQMPLFFIISGYVTRYSKSIVSAGALSKFLRKRTLAYIVPWIVWTFLVRGIILGQHSFFNIRYLFWHMDNGYWFLISLWTIVVIFGISDWLSNKCNSKTLGKSIILHLLFSILGMLILASIGLVMGLSFFSIKLSLYYLPLFMLGYIYGQLQESFDKIGLANNIRWMTCAIALALWLFLILRVNFYATEVSISIILLRYIASLAGCVAVIGCTRDCYDKIGGVALAGKYSLEIYLLHYLLLKPLPLNLPVSLMSLSGFLTMTVQYVLTMVMVAVIIALIIKNPPLNKFLFYKKTSVPAFSIS